MDRTRTQNAVRNLVNLYTVVIGVALSNAVVRLLDPSKGLDAILPDRIALFVAFVVTLLPFFHGALRHLDDAFVENKTEHLRRGVLIFDFALLFLHAMAFVVLSLLLHKPGQFAWVLAAVIAVDVIWAAFAHFASSSRGGSLSAEGKWGIINLVFFIAVSSILVMTDTGFGQEVVTPMKVALPLAGACIVRTLVDYVWCGDFYFPTEG